MPGRSRNGCLEGRGTVQNDRFVTLRYQFSLSGIEGAHGKYGARRRRTRLHRRLTACSAVGRAHSYGEKSCQFVQEVGPCPAGCQEVQTLCGAGGTGPLRKNICKPPAGRAAAVMNVL
jgi:hypothetical protein